MPRALHAQFGGVSTQNPRKELACNFFHEYLRVFLRWLILLVVYTQVVFISLQQQLAGAHGAHGGWCKIRNRHCRKRLFTEKKKSTYYTFSVVEFFLLRTFCFVNRRFMLCKFLGSRQKWGSCYLTHQLLFSNKFNVSDFSTLSFFSTC